jgi:hypothetical protein
MPDNLDESTIAGAALIGDNEAIARLFLQTDAAQTNTNHRTFTPQLIRSQASAYQTESHWHKNVTQ